MNNRIVKKVFKFILKVLPFGKFWISNPLHFSMSVFGLWERSILLRIINKINMINISKI